MEKECVEIKLHSKMKQSGEVLIERAVKSVEKTLYEKGLQDKYDNADGVLKDFLKDVELFHRN